MITFLYKKDGIYLIVFVLEIPPMIHQIKFKLLPRCTPSNPINLCMLHYFNYLNLFYLVIIIRGRASFGLDEISNTGTTLNYWRDLKGDNGNQAGELQVSLIWLSHDNKVYSFLYYFII